MNKLKLFLENFLVYGLGGIIQKIIPLIMVPIVTRIMPDSTYYGLIDLSHTLVSLASALAVMGMYDAMYRMFFEKEDEEFKKDICSTALVFTLCTSLVVFLGMMIFSVPLSGLFFKDKQYDYLVYISAMATLIGATNSIVSAPTRMQNQKKIFLIMNAGTSILSYSISIPLLLAGHYVIALPLAGLITAITSEGVFLLLNRHWFNFKRFHKEYLKPLLSIAIPLLPNFLIYWVFNSSDKIMITNLMDAGATGIYSVGSKLGHASQLIYTAFAGGWQYFAFATMKEDNQVKTNSMIFEYLGIISYSCSTFVFALAKPIYELLFNGEYVSCFIVSPYLFLAPLMQMLFQVIANQFLVVKKTWPNLLILSLGAIVNIGLNLSLIPVLGFEGAGIATLIGYVISDIVCVIVLLKMKLMTLQFRFIIASIVMAGFILLWRILFMHNILISLLLAVICCCIFVLLYINDLKSLVNNFKNKGETKNET